MDALSLAASEGLLSMRTMPHITARTLIWLSAITVPVQGALAKACCCSRLNSPCRLEQSAQSDASTERDCGHCCCGKAAQASVSSCCAAPKGCAAFCQCGMNCQCHRGSQPQPATPPIADSAPKCAVGDLVAALSERSPQAAQFQAIASGQAETMAAGACCAVLCRFTL
jgi:hypothetical protein